MAADQFNVGVPVTKAQLQPGDIVFFKDSTGYVHHEGIYIGNDMFLHAPHTGDVVKISSLDEPYYAQQFAGGRDVSGLATGATPAGAPAAGGVRRRLRRPSRARGRRPPATRPCSRPTSRAAAERRRPARAASSAPSRSPPSNPPPGPGPQHRPDPPGRQGPERAPCG